MPSVIDRLSAAGLVKKSTAPRSCSLRIHQSRRIAAHRAQQRRSVHLRHERPGVRCRCGRGSRRRSCCTSARRSCSTWPWSSPLASWRVAHRLPKRCTSLSANVLGTDGKMLRSRTGDPVALRTVLDEAIERGIAAVAAKNPDLPAELRQSIGHAVGVGALKYADLSTTACATTSSTGTACCRSTATRRRTCSTPTRDLFVVSPAGVDRDEAGGDAGARRGTTQERALALRLLGYEGALVEAVGRYSPHRLCTYLFELATDFTAFYEHCPVLKAPTGRVRTSPCQRAHRSHARPWARPARHRHPRTDVSCPEASRR